MLVQNVDKAHKQSIIRHLCNQIQSFKEFNCKNYCNTLCEIDEFLQTNSIDIKITDNLNNLEKDAEIFVEYVLCAKENYPLYKVIVNPNDLSKYLSDRVTDKHSVLEVLKYLINDDKYNFGPVTSKIEEIIQNQQLIKDDNFKPLFDAYKILSSKKPLKVQLNATQRQTIWNALASKQDTPEFLEMVMMEIAAGVNRANVTDAKQIKYIAENLDYYANYGELLISNLSWNIPTLQQALKHMTENKLGYILSIEKVLPKFIEIKNNLAITEISLLEQLNRWERFKNTITATNIQQIVPNVQFFQFSKATKNILTDYLNRTAIEALSSKITTDQLYQFRQSQLQNYWVFVLNALIDTDFIKPLPDNLTELGKRFLDDIAASRLAIPNTNDMVSKLIEKLDRRKTAAHIKDIRDRYCNSQYNINAQQFLYFESWFESQGDLIKVANRATHRIIEPVINDVNCMNTICAKSDYYADIINAAGDDAATLKTAISNKVQNSTDNKLIVFAKKIGVEQEKLNKEL